MCHPSWMKHRNPIRRGKPESAIPTFPGCRLARTTALSGFQPVSLIKQDTGQRLEIALIKGIQIRFAHPIHALIGTHPQRPGLVFKDLEHFIVSHSVPAAIGPKRSIPKPVEPTVRGPNP